MLESGTEGGYVLIRLGNDESLGRELRTYLQTEKYVCHKNDGTLPESTKKILREFADDNQERRSRLVTLLGEMLAEADNFVAGQPLKLKATSAAGGPGRGDGIPRQEHVHQDGLPQAPEPGPAQGNPGRSSGQRHRPADARPRPEEGNKQAIEDVRNYVGLMAASNKQIVLHDMIEKRYTHAALRLARRRGADPGGPAARPGRDQPDDGRGLGADRQGVQGRSRPRPSRRKITILKRQTTDPKAIQNARSLGKELFPEMGPDGEDALFAFLQTKLKGWQTSLSGYKPLADTGNYPGKDEITDGLLAIKKLLGCDGSFKFIERFNTLKTDLLDLADNFNDLEQFYEHQKADLGKAPQGQRDASGSTGSNSKRTPRRVRP